ncbi:hypothetical protein Acry_3370 (plasmid) [Acidiphilium cryptum JF-5]|uniref:Uncharacterized protein n=1 Tax=Acidiphilium cryptum (strain JF-5) TaxID=349163 RepID=A5FTP9_ACICJ|nr:hypothetical protein Acry_3370 [Acidiphilium cryptum JF-5]
MNTKIWATKQRVKSMSSMPMPARLVWTDGHDRAPGGFRHADRVHGRDARGAVVKAVTDSSVVGPSRASPKAIRPGFRRIASAMEAAQYCCLA